MNSGIAQATHYIQKHIDQPLPLEVLADIACMSPVHFHRQFKAAMGYAPALYVRLHKVRHALELLRTEAEQQQGLQVQDLAVLTGFAHYETFSRAFYRHVGMAPSDLQGLLFQLVQESDVDKPLVLSASAELSQLQYLAEDALDRAIFRPDQLNELQVCLIRQQTGKHSRKLSERYRLQFDETLSRQLIAHLRA